MLITLGLFSESVKSHPEMRLNACIKKNCVVVVVERGGGKYLG
jgi:hypothetical protein